MTDYAAFASSSGWWRGPPLGAAVALLSFGAATAFVPAESLTPMRKQIGSVHPNAPQGSVAELIALTEISTPLVNETDAALRANAELPLVNEAVQSALPFQLPTGLGEGTAFNAQTCLALAIYYEAAYEGSDGRRAVAQVVLNRVKHPAFPNTVCSVVFQRSSGNVCQFTFACDGAMRRKPEPELWRQSFAEAGEALHGKVYAPVGMATHYHADYVFPYWAPKLEKVAVVGRHLFYRWPRGWGLRGAFNDKYGGIESGPSALVAPAPSETPEVTLPTELAPLAQEAVPVRNENDGGFVDPSKGWVPRISRKPLDSESAQNPNTEVPPAP
jgi:Cell Wall Hydrolase